MHKMLDNEYIEHCSNCYQRTIHFIYTTVQAVSADECLINIQVWCKNCHKEHVCIDKMSIRFTEVS